MKKLQGRPPAVFRLLFYKIKGMFLAAAIIFQCSFMLVQETDALGGLAEVLNERQNTG